MSHLRELVKENDPLLQALRIGPHHFPGIWSYMLPQEFLALKFPAEQRATCMSCPKACYAEYKPDYRCCTYHPRVANFLLGLASLTTMGETVIDKLLARGMLLPEGMHYAPAQWFDYLDDLEHDRFGKSDKVLCPNLDQSTGYCMIHAFRNSVCSTFFCYKDHGDPGDHFWGHVQTLGSQVEMALSHWSLHQVGFDLERYFKTFDKLSKSILKVSGHQGWKDEALVALWGDWYGRERELFQACAAEVARHRENLWEIANSFPIGESLNFEKALVRAVPRRLKNQVDPEDLENAGGDSVRPRELWLQALKSYHKLWDWPEGFFELSPRVDIRANPQATDEDRFYGSKEHLLLYYVRKDSKTVESKLYLSTEEKAVLDVFRGAAIMLDWRMLDHPAMVALGRGKEFISEMIAQKILVRRVYH
jgi:Fe-S-cluster containining protein